MGRHFRNISMPIIGILFSFSICFGNPTDLVEQSIYDYFQDTYNVSPTDLDLRIINIPEIVIKSNEVVRIDNEHNKTRLGYQTLWVKVYEGQLLSKKYPVLVQASININTIVANRRINREEIITQDMVRVQKNIIKNNYYRIIKDVDAVVGFMAKHVIKNSEILKHSMVKIPPHIKRGDQVNIQLKSQDLVIQTTGQAIQDGNIGDKIRIVYEPTHKKGVGIVYSNELVVIDIGR